MTYHIRTALLSTRDQVGKIAFIHQTDCFPFGKLLHIRGEIAIHKNDAVLDVLGCHDTIKLANDLDPHEPGLPVLALHEDHIAVLSQADIHAAVLAIVDVVLSMIETASWKPCLKRRVSGIFCYHTLRHFGASLLEQTNVPIGSIQRLLGHENRSTTEIYLHSIRDSDREAMRILNDGGLENISHSTDSINNNKVSTPMRRLPFSVTCPKSWNQIRA